MLSRVLVTLDAGLARSRFTGCSPHRATTNYNTLKVTVTTPRKIKTSLLTSSDFCESESYVTTDGQSVSLSWNKAPIWGLRPDFYYCLTVAGLLIWGALSDERTGLSFTIAADLRTAQSFSGPSPVELATIFYCLRFETSFSSPPTTRWATVEAFDPASTWD
jgi:hypothetical protein